MVLIPKHSFHDSLFPTANLHLHHYVVQQNSVQQVREVQLPVPVPVRCHECLHLRETPVSGLTGQMFGNQGQ